MKKKKILLCLFLIMVFILMPNKVYAVQNCDLNVSNITNNSAKLIWVCREGEPNSVSVYKSDANYSTGADLGLGDGWIRTKSGTQVITGLSPNSYYLISVAIKKGDVTNAWIKTAGSNVSGTDVVKKKIGASNGDGGTCSYDTNNITATSAKITGSCSKGGFNSVTIYKSNSACKVGDIVEETGALFESKELDRTFNGLEPNTYYFISYKIGDKNIPAICIKTPSLVSKGQLLKTIASKDGSKFDQNLTITEVENGDRGDYDWNYERYDGELTSNDTDVRTGFCKDSLKDLIHKYWMWIIILSPILLILLISFDIVKAVISNDSDAIKKSGSTAIKRTVAVVVILFTPFLLKLIFGLFGLEDYICF